MIVSAIVGLITGAIASLVAPWAHWRVDIQRQKREAKQEIITTFRSQLVRFLETTTDPAVRDYFQSSTYYRIREYLDRGYVAELEKLWDTELRHPSVKSLINRLLSDLARLEKDWDLL